MICDCACHDTRGHRINRRATLGMLVTNLHQRIPELEKLARKTPPKTLLSEVRKVEAAKLCLPQLRTELETLEKELNTLKASAE